MSWALKEAKDFDCWGWNGKETNSDNELSRNKVMKEAKPRGCLEQPPAVPPAREIHTSNNWLKGEAGSL